MTGGRRGYLAFALCSAFLMTVPAGLGAAAAPDERIPLPRPRPLSAPARTIPSAMPALSKTADFDAPAMRPSLADKAAPPAAPSACRLALTDKIAVAPSVPPIDGPGGCGGEDMVSLEAVVLADGNRVTVTPPAKLRCEMASAVTEWIRRDVAMLAAGQGARLQSIDNFDSYSCRGRNRVFGAKLSEHGKGNALDIRAFKLADGSNLSLTSVEVTRTLREAMRVSACTRFTTVLGPGSDGYHEDHVHVDLAQRRGNHRLCRWDVRDPPPVVVTEQNAAGRNGAARENSPQASSAQVGSGDTVLEETASDEAASEESAPGIEPSGKRKEELRQNSKGTSKAASPRPGSGSGIMFAESVLPQTRASANAAQAFLVPLPRPRPAQAPPRNDLRIVPSRNEPPPD